jgi:uncharacterized protein YqhQ
VQASLVSSSHNKAIKCCLHWYSCKCVVTGKEQKFIHEKKSTYPNVITESGLAVTLGWGFCFFLLSVFIASLQVAMSPHGLLLAQTDPLIKHCLLLSKKINVSTQKYIPTLNIKVTHPAGPPRR